MSASITQPSRSALNSYDAPDASAMLLVRALESTINGHPLPEALQPPRHITNPPVQPFADWVR